MKDTISIIQHARSDQDYDWQKQLRFYLTQEGKAMKAHAEQFTFSMDYQYEFIGNSKRIIQTPLSDRCIMTMTQALSFYKGGAPQGPAGTGKTETIKDLAKNLGVYCYVFNVSETVPLDTLQRLIIGVGSIGSWLCLDEFNRLGLNHLSQIGNTLKQMQDHLRAQSTEWPYEGINRILKPQMGVFITQNPSYKGRTVLPDSVKVLFRPFSMIVPDFELIAENLMVSEGFKEARTLSQLMIRLFKFAK